MLANTGALGYFSKKRATKQANQLEDWELDGTKVPRGFLLGIPFMKVSGRGGKSPKERIFRIDADQGHIIWESRRRGVINIENIKELRLGSMAHSEIARLVPEGLNNADTVNRWLTIIYTIEDEYKTLNLLAPSAELLTAWHDTVAALRRLRLDFMSGIVADSSGALWDRHHWKGADESGDNKLDYGEVEHLCRRLNFGGSKSELKKRLKEVDKGGKGYLTFDEFKIFVKELKRSPEVTKIYDEARQGSPFSFAVFDTFMRNTQKSKLSPEEHERIYRLFATPPPTTQQTSTTTQSTEEAQSTQAPPAASGTTAPTPAPAAVPVAELPPLALETFTTFLQSTHNMAFIEPQRHIDSESHPEKHLNHPLSHYFINSSHNTYLVGNQLVGESSVEGYIRALLAGSRSVEMDIYDGPEASKALDPDEKGIGALGGALKSTATVAAASPSPAANAAAPAKNVGDVDPGDVPGDWGAGIIPFDYTGIISTEPIVTHGGTLTTSLSARSICHAINRYAFVTSDYPVIISAEIHCSVRQQKILVRIMEETFGDKLVVAPVNEDLSDADLPSPYSLRGRILLKAKNKFIEQAHAEEIVPRLPDEPESDDDNDHDDEGEEAEEKKKSNYVKDIASSAVGKVGKLFGYRSGRSSPAPPTPLKDPQPGRAASPAPPVSLAPTSSVQNVAPASDSTTTGGITPPVPEKDTNAAGSATNTGANSAKQQQPTLVLPASDANPTRPSQHRKTPSGSSVLSKASAISNRSARSAKGGKLPMAPELLPLLVYTTGVSFRGLAPAQAYAPSHLFSLSESRAKSLIHNPNANQVALTEMNASAPNALTTTGSTTAPAMDKGTETGTGSGSGKTSVMESALLVRHTRKHVVRVYPKGTRVDSSNYEPHVFWAVGCQLVTLNFQTVDVGWHINSAMFRQNNRAGYILKPPALLDPTYPFDHKRHKPTKHILQVRIISAHQLPRPKDALGQEVVDKDMVDPFVKVALHIPIWANGKSSLEIAPVKTTSPSKDAEKHITKAATDASNQVAQTGELSQAEAKAQAQTQVQAQAQTENLQQQGVLVGHEPSTGSKAGAREEVEAGAAIGERKVKMSTEAIRDNGFNPTWNQTLKLPYDLFGECMDELVFVRFLVKDSNLDKDTFVGGYCTSLASLQMGYRFLPLYDEQMNQILFASLCVHISIEAL